MKKLILFGLCVMVFSFPAQSQFLKKLKSKVEQKVERAVTENVSNKAANQADKSLNKMWETSLKNSPMAMGGSSANLSEVPDNYNFNWEYLLKMETKEGDIDMAYLLKEEAPYFGMQVPQAEGMFMVVDTQKMLTVMYFSSGNNKFLNATKINDPTEIENEFENSELREIGSRTILNYNCQGYATENEDYVFTFYITEEAPVSFTNMFQNSKSNIPNGWNKKWFDDKNALMMEMQMEDKKNPKNNMTMRCTGINKNAFSISKSDYKSMLGE